MHLFVHFEIALLNQHKMVDQRFEGEIQLNKWIQFAVAPMLDMVTTYEHLHSLKEH